MPHALAVSLRSLSLAAVAAGTILAADALVPDEAHALCVRGVASNDVLNMRSAPGTGNRIVGVIPPGVCGVRSVRRSGRWRKVRYGGTTGWVNGRFLEADGDDSAGRPPSRGSHCVTGVASNDVLNIRRAPTTRSAIKRGIPPRACGIRINYVEGAWKHVTYRGTSGFVYGRFVD